MAGYLVYFIFTIVATCEGWQCWSHGCGFILMGKHNFNQSYFSWLLQILLLSSDSVSSCFPSACVFLVSLDIFSVAILLLGGALACYGVLLFSKMSNVRSEMASNEMWKVASLAAVSVTCFTSSAVLALVTNIPVCCCTLLTYTFCATSSGLKLHLKISMFLCAAGGAFLLAFGTIRPHKQFSSYISLLFYRYA
ncbi:hypothetical protein BHE74_00001220 [Ensete ventricosum]|nr:hypothetical protein GW17_00029438 [Ensete ventricosum]RWW89731.1 hypothetical protein BHE74_00001220 [Ensete ventricosum]RZR95521.1 hypothetical protein BHM03_00024380 [Ensete ventricosum]